MKTIPTKELVVAPEGMAHLLENLGADANPRQMIRELTQNAIDAVGRRSGPGRILWTADKDQPHKLTLIDNGDGMTGDEMVDYINRLSSSASTRSLVDHFGVGAKITAGVRNPYGLVYESWKNGQSARIVFWKDPSTGRYGLKPLVRQDGTVGLWSDIMTSSKPTRVINQHGTKVTLMGYSESDNTTCPPAGQAEFSGSDWVARYLSSRYAQLPANIDLRVSTKPTYEFSTARVVTPRIQYLNENSQDRGVVSLAGVKAHWWILNPVKPSTLVEDKGHVGVIFQNELYEQAFRRQGAALLNHAGVIAGPDRIVLYFEPISAQGNFVKASTARNGLRIESEQPPVVEWALAFSDHTPDAIKSYIDRLLEETPENSAKKLQGLITRLHELFNSPSFRHHKNGDVAIAPASNGISTPAFIDANGHGGLLPTPSNNDNGLANRLRKKMAEDQSGSKGKKSKDLTIPDISWVDGDHDEQLRDCAAKYDSVSHRLIVNNNFRGFKSLLSYMQREYIDPRNPNKDADKFLVATVKDYYTQVLVEAVWGILNLSEQGAFLPEEYVTQYLTPQGLTMAVQAKSEIRDNVAKAMRHQGYKMLTTQDHIKPSGP